jgi:hypothetical protein
VKDWDVNELIGVNFLFFEAQESGWLRDNHRIQWRGESYVNDKHGDTSLQGGWFDAGGAPATSSKNSNACTSGFAGMQTISVDSDADSNIPNSKRVLSEF